MELVLLTGVSLSVVAGIGFYLRRAMRAAIVVEPNHPELAAVQTPVEIAWYYRPGEVFLRQVINARSKSGVWRS